MNAFCRRLPRRRTLMIILTSISCAILAGLVAFSPFALAALADLGGHSGKLSSVSQTYGPVSVLISSLALGGALISLLYQARAGHTAHEAAIRTLQQQLIRMEMDEPSLMTAIGAPWRLPIPAESERIREHLYIHMWVSFWAGSYVVGELTEAAARGVIRNELFNGAAGRQYWSTVRENILGTNEGRYRQFAFFIEEEYQDVMARNIEPAEPVRISGRSEGLAADRTRNFRALMLAGAALAIGILAGRESGRWGHRSQQAP